MGGIDRSDDRFLPIPVGCLRLADRGALYAVARLLERVFDQRGAVVLHHAFGLEGREEELVSSGQPLDYRFGVRGNFYRVCFDRVFLATLAPR